MYGFSHPVPEPRISTHFFPGADGVSKIRVRVWEGTQGSGDNPRGVIQVVHGMSEHAERYDAFAAYMVNAGYVVLANDHIGHGRSVACEADLGHIPLSSGKEVMIADLHKLRTYVGDHYGSQTPYILFGHSMGSFLVRTYLARHADAVDAAVICGTGQQPALLSAGGKMLARLLCAVKGERFRSAFLDNMGAGSYAKNIPNARTKFDWLATDPSVVDSYLNDPMAGFMFTVAGYAALTDLTAEMVKPACAQAVPKNMPLLFIAGEEDPVGDCGRGVRAAVQQYRSAGCTCVEEILYPGMRHEILNEPIRQQVCEDVLQWLSRL